MIYKITVQELGGAWTLTLGTLDLGLWLLESMEQDFVDGTARDCGDGGGGGESARDGLVTCGGKERELWLAAVS